MIYDIKHDIVKILLNMEKRGEVKRIEAAQITGTSLEKNTAIENLDNNTPKKSEHINRTVVNTQPEVGRNEPCPCGSGKKYKQCCGK